ncbi:MAG TPA: YibE/F family protein, partial [Candidatus Kapabacteria bacterium]|nr:YibE/F family protein [Candidatus Kapabacteria bacterium]
FLVTILFGGRRGGLSFIGLLGSIAVIMWFIIPRILNGASPLPTLLVGTLGIAGISMFLAHGFRARTTVALVCTMMSIALSYTLSLLFLKITSLTGMGSEEAFYLQFSDMGSIDARGLLFGGILLGVLGVLDDITTAQTAAVEEIHKANPTLNQRELFVRGSSVGKEHISSLVNTLVLAYVGASIPLLLLFFIYPRPLWVTLNSELLMEEMIRTLVGSFTLILTVPLTTYLASTWFSRHPTKPV